MTRPNLIARREAVAKIIAGFGPCGPNETWGPATQAHWRDSLTKADAILSTLEASDADTVGVPREFVVAASRALVESNILERDEHPALVRAMDRLGEVFTLDLIEAADAHPKPEPVETQPAIPENAKHHPLCSFNTGKDGTRCDYDCARDYQQPEASRSPVSEERLREQAIALVQAEARELGYIEEDVAEIAKGDGDDLLAIQAVERALCLTPSQAPSEERAREVLAHECVRFGLTRRAPHSDDVAVPTDIVIRAMIRFATDTQPVAGGVSLSSPPDEGVGSCNCPCHKGASIMHVRPCCEG